MMWRTVTMVALLTISAGGNARSHIDPPARTAAGNRLLAGQPTKAAEFTFEELWRVGGIDARPEAEFTGPFFVTAFGPAGQATILDYYQARVSMFDGRSGAFVRAFSRAGQGAGELDALGAQPDTTFVLGSKNIDMTGDGASELLVLLAHGPTIDSLEVTFQILSSHRIVYAARMDPLLRRMREPEGRGMRTEAQQIERLNRFGEEFFAESKFVSASGFVAELERVARGSVAEIPRVIARHRAIYQADALGGLDVGPLSTDTTGAGALWSDLLARDRIVFRFSPGGDRATAIVWSDLDRRFYQLMLCC